MSLHVISLVLVLLCLNSVHGQVLQEIQGLKNGQKEIRNLLLDVLQELTDPVRPMKWYTGGSALLSVKKVTTGDKIRVEVELYVSPEEQVYWVLDDSFIEVNNSEFGTSITRSHNSTLYTITVPVSSKSLYLTSTSRANVDVVYEIDIKSGDDSLSISNPRNCRVSINDVNSTSTGAYFRCTPDLDSKDKWSQELSLGAKTFRDKVSFTPLKTKTDDFPNQEPFNVMFERHSSANAMVVFSKEFKNKTKTFLFLLSSLKIETNHIIKAIFYSYLKDISQERNYEEYVFLEDNYLQPEPLEGEQLTVICKAIGRKLPSIRVERNGTKILKGPGVSITNSRTNEKATYSVTFLHVTKNVEGNYSCVGESMFRTVLPLYQVELKPRIYPNEQPIRNSTETTSFGLVVEGSKGVFLTCSSPDQEEIPFKIVERTALSKWNERLEVKVSPPIKKSENSETQRVVCTAGDKNGETTFEHYFYSSSYFSLK